MMFYSMNLGFLIMSYFLSPIHYPFSLIVCLILLFQFCHPFLYLNPSQPLFLIHYLNLSKKFILFMCLDLLLLYILTHPISLNFSLSLIMLSVTMSPPVSLALLSLPNHLLTFLLKHSLFLKSMLTFIICNRAKSGFAQPRLEHILFLVIYETNSVKHALIYLNYKTTMQEEYDVLIKNNTRNLVPLPFQRHDIGFKWIFRVKENPVDTVNKYKDMFVSMGFHQRYGFEFTETFSHVVKSITFKIILSIAPTYKWSIQ